MHKKAKCKITPKSFQQLLALYFVYISSFARDRNFAFLGLKVYMLFRKFYKLKIREEFMFTAYIIRCLCFKGGNCAVKLQLMCLH